MNQLGKDIVRRTCNLYMGRSMAELKIRVSARVSDRARQMTVISGTEGPASAVVSGDDTVSIHTLINGTVDSIKLELEVLSTVGEVSLHVYHGTPSVCNAR